VGFTRAKLAPVASSAQVLRYAAFTDDPRGGNPAGVVLGAGGMDQAQMLAVAAEVGYSETAFLEAREGPGREYDVRYFSPAAEVPFCGHATIASGCILAERDGAGELLFHTPSGDVSITTAVAPDGALTATLTSVAPHVLGVSSEDLEEALGHLRWAIEDLDEALPPAIAFAGARHLILAAATRERLAALDYDFEGLRAFMSERDLITLELVWRESELVFHARDPFPVGGVVEDPATGAGAAAFGAYLRERGAVTPPARVTIHQGADMGRPSLLLVDIGEGAGGLAVTGTAVPIPG
jgi:PhzF family phenazine biosynthesis protein